MASAQPKRRKPEVLAPAGGLPQLQAAVRAGADAVYFGLDVGLNARARAANFTTEELPGVMSFLHSHGVTWGKEILPCGAFWCLLLMGFAFHFIISSSI